MRFRKCVVAMIWWSCCASRVSIKYKKKCKQLAYCIGQKKYHCMTVYYANIYMLHVYEVSSTWVHIEWLTTSHNHSHQTTTMKFTGHLPWPATAGFNPRAVPVSPFPPVPRTRNPIPRRAPPSCAPWRRNSRRSSDDHLGRSYRRIFRHLRARRESTCFFC